MSLLLKKLSFGNFSRNIYLNTARIELDKRLLKNYFLSRGYYDVQILSRSSAEITDKNDIDLTFSINAGKDIGLKNFQQISLQFLIKKYLKI